MGVIRSQSVKSTIITYIGFSIGAINMMFIMPYILSNVQIGLTQLFTALATQIVALGSIGASVILNKFLPYYKTHLESAKRDLLTVILVVGTLGMLTVLGLCFYNENLIIRKFAKNSELFVNYLFLFPMFSFGYFYYYIFDSLNNNYKFTVWSTFVRELIFKLFNLLIILLFAIRFINFREYMHLFAIMYWLGALLIVLNLVKHDLFYIQFKISRLTKRLRFKMFQYALSSWGINILGITSQFIDTFAIAGLRGLGQTAIYSLARFIITPVIMPSAAVINISIPFISEAWRQNDTSKINDIYKKSALVLIIVCGFIFFLIWSSIDDILRILPDKFYGSAQSLQSAKYVILFLGLARMCDFATSVNNYILQTSKKYYWIDFYGNICLIIMMIPLNYFMIRKYGILGAGYANFVAFFVINTLKALYLYLKEKMHPFSIQWWLVIALFVIGLMLSYSLNYLFSHLIFNETANTIFIKIIRIIIRSLILSAVFIPLLYKLKISKDINELIDSILAKALNLFSLLKH